MRRVNVIARHVACSDVKTEHVLEPISTAGGLASADPIVAFRSALKEYSRSIEKLRTQGEMPSMSIYELYLLRPKNLGPNLERLLDAAESDGSLAVLQLLPGPWKDAQTRTAKISLLQNIQLAQQRGQDLQLYADYQYRYGDQGLGSNIIVPTVMIHSDLSKGLGSGTWRGDAPRLGCRAIIAHPEDAERIARLHVLKEPNFGGFLDSVISTTDNKHWRDQRKHLVEAFLPISSLAQILPVSLSRAKECAARLGKLSEIGSAIDMSDFLLHELQAQLQLALLGAPESLMNATNEKLRKTFMQHPVAETGPLSEAMKSLMKIVKEDETLALPTDGCPVRGPLSRALQIGGYAPSTDYGNMLIILFAGHDTTGHTMTWLLFELARNQEVQIQVQQEIDLFFSELGGCDPTYNDLSRLEFLDRCITETLRMWPAVGNGTFRQLQFDEHVRGTCDSQVTLPKGTYVNIVNWSRHRNPELWGQDADTFNPYRDFAPMELAHVGCPMAATNPQSKRFSPFAHNPRSCLGKNFAQMEMRLILSYLLRRFSFTLAPPYDALQEARLSATGSDPDFFRAVNRGGTMGPLDLEHGGSTSHAENYLIGLKLKVSPRA